MSAVANFQGDPSAEMILREFKKGQIVEKPNLRRDLPLSRLDPRRKRAKLAQSPMLGGISPSKSFEINNNWNRFLRLNKESGIDPVR